MTATTGVRPLDDLLIVELGNTIATAYVGHLLADLGARVVRVDDLTADHPLVEQEPLVGGADSAAAGGTSISAVWLHLNRLKESVQFDLTQAGGRDVLSRLIGKADVLLDGSGVDALANLGLTYADLRAANERLLVVSITPFGLSGPYRDLHGSDLVVEALSGLLNMVGFPEREPLKLGGSQAQYATGLAAFAGTLAGLAARDRLGHGQVVDVSMMETVAFSEWKSAAYYEADGNVRYRVGNQSHWLVLEANDGYVALVYQDDNFVGLQNMTGIEELRDPRFAKRADRAKYADELRGLFAPWFRERSKLEVYHAGQANGVPLGFVATIGDLVDSPQYAARGFWQHIEYPGLGDAVYPGRAFHLSGVDLVAGRAPQPGEHTAAVTAEVTSGEGV